ncbi:hypothetical protein FHS29_004644 [Saccharothrix tamanrassetensis]|uniref:Immunity protein Imm1 n=1 Tax=Saccharothrix tamanrassetensis TaxID=1051531 RepID=A0A841CRB4_9PSEU|nr:Imm1 family immunity protein [Saccharothrix tamanrassetensis]MBB5958036.1 hypothetical protein [Saccharothrix tamanrassetensis]
MEHDRPTIVSTPAELDDVLDVMTGWGGPALADFRLAGVQGDLKRMSLSVGIRGDAGRGTLIHTSPGAVLFAKGTPGPWATWSPPELLLYDYMTNPTEFPPDAELPLADVREAAQHYLTTGGGRLARIDWQTPPPAHPTAY